MLLSLQTVYEVLDAVVEFLLGKVGGGEDFEEEVIFGEEVGLVGEEGVFGLLAFWAAAVVVAF